MASSEDYLTPVAPSDPIYEEISEPGKGEINDAYYLELLENPPYADISTPEENQDPHHYARLQLEGSYEHLQRGGNPKTQPPETLEEPTHPEQHCCKKTPWWSWALLIAVVVIITGVIVIGLQVAGILTGGHQLPGGTSAGSTTISSTTTATEGATTVQFELADPSPAHDCLDARLKSLTPRSGITRIIPDGGSSFQVFCDQQTHGGGWTIFQHWEDGRQNFYLPWNAYKNGFGNLSHNFWLGNDKLHQLTDQTLLVLLKKSTGQIAFAIYSHFAIEAEADNYRLRISGYTNESTASNSLYNDIQFTTHDIDIDYKLPHFALMWHGAWWYTGNAASNLNGYWYDTGVRGVHWGAWGCRGIGTITSTTMMERTRT